jgi:mono/diheme cytochrome c family protein
MRLQPFVRHPEGSIPELENSTACEPATAPATAGCRLARLAARLLRLGRLGAAWLVASLMIGASAQAAEPGAGKAGAPATVRADLLYHNYCSVCHGDRGDGRSRARGSLVPPPRDFTSPQSLGELTRDRMIAATAAGKPGTAMVGWSTQLGPREIEAVVDYVIDTFMKPRTLASFETGRALYARSCASCHGADGQGGPAGVGPTGASVSAARNFTAPRARTDLTRERMVSTVTHGLPGTAMAGFATQMSGAEIGAVVDFVRAAFMGASPADASGTSAHRGRSDVHAAVPGMAPLAPAPSSAPPAGGMPASPAVKADMSLPLPMQLVGQAARGRKFYNDNCATCHGVKGDAQGPRAYFIRPKPRNFLTADSRAQFNRPALFAGISMGRVGSEMPAWNKVISEQQIADLTEYVFQSFIRPEAGPRR